MRVLLTLAVHGWQLLQLDINNAFLNGDLFEEVYMDLPIEYRVKGEHFVSRLNKSIYGLRQDRLEGGLVKKNLRAGGGIRTSVYCNCLYITTGH